MLGKCSRTNSGLAVRDVEVDIVEAEPLDLGRRPGDDVPRSELGALVELRHEPLAPALDPGGSFQLPALAAHCLGNQEVLTSRL